MPAYAKLATAFKLLDMQAVFTSDRCTIRTIEYDYLTTPFGDMLTAWHKEMLCFASFTTYLGREKIYSELTALFPKATFTHTKNRPSIFESAPKKILLAGTPFRCDVWRALLTVERGTTMTYAQLAARANHPTAVRAVATSVGCNPISVIVPCHRILPASGGVGNYHTGAEIKRRLLEWENALP